MDAFLKEYGDVSAEERVIVMGYIRNEQNILPEGIFYIIPKLVIFLCMAYYHEPEQWDADSCDDGIYIDDNVVSNKIESYKSIAMKKIVEYGEHEWSFEVNYMSHGWQILGVWKCEQFNLKQGVDEVGYGFIMNNGMKTNPVSRGHYGGLYGVEVNNGDIVTMKLDLEKYELSYEVNGKYYGIAFGDIEPTKYRAALTMCHQNSKFTFLSYKQIK